MTAKPTRKEIAALEKWEAATVKMVQTFVDKYFEGTADWHFVADRVGDVLCVGDYYFNIDDALTSLRYNATFEQLSDYYYMSLEAAIENKRLDVNYENYVRFNLQPKIAEGV